MGTCSLMFLIGREREIYNYTQDTKFCKHKCKERPIGQEDTFIIMLAAFFYPLCVFKFGRRGWSRQRLNFCEHKCQRPIGPEVSTTFGKWVRPPLGRSKTRYILEKHNRLILEIWLKINSPGEVFFWDHIYPDGCRSSYSIAAIRSRHAQGQKLPGKISQLPKDFRISVSVSYQQKRNFLRILNVYIFILQGFSLKYFPLKLPIWIGRGAETVHQK